MDIPDLINSLKGKPLDHKSVELLTHAYQFVSSKSAEYQTQVVESKLTIDQLQSQLEVVRKESTAAAASDGSMVDVKKIFVASRMKNVVERKAVIDVIHMLGHIPVFIEAEQMLPGKESKDLMVRNG